MRLWHARWRWLDLHSLPIGLIGRRANWQGVGVEQVMAAPLVDGAVVIYNDSALRFSVEQARPRVPVGIVNPSRNKPGWC